MAYGTHIYVYLGIYEMFLSNVVVLSDFIYINLCKRLNVEEGINQVNHVKYRILKFYFYIKEKINPLFKN